MPCLDAKALENDQEGMAFLRSVLSPATGEVRPRPALPEPMPFPEAVVVPASASHLAKSRRARRAGQSRPALG
jgi:hypothetical protein